jgi:hypothetical protein
MAKAGMRIKHGAFQMKKATCVDCPFGRLAHVKWAKPQDCERIFQVGKAVLVEIVNSGFVRIVKGGKGMCRATAWCVEDIDNALKAIAEGRHPSTSAAKNGK